MRSIPARTPAPPVRRARSAAVRCRSQTKPRAVHRAVAVPVNRSISVAPARVIRVAPCRHRVQPGARRRANSHGACPKFGSAAAAPPPRAPAPGASAALTTLPPSATPKDEFDLGIGYMQRKDYALAEETMKNFGQKYPSDPLIADSQYWLGESYFQRQQYRDAAEAFLGVTTKFDKSGKAPDALLRLGQSLAALKEKEAACAALGEVTRKYPRASAGVKAAVDREQKRVKC